MTGETAKNRAPSKVGWSPEPVVTHGDLVDLLYGLDADDAHVPDTWRYLTRYLTDYEQMLVRNATPQAWADAQTLRDLDSARGRADLEWLRFMRDALHPNRNTDDA